MSDLSEAERQFLVRLLKRSIGYKSNGDIVRQARSLLAKIEGDGVVLQVLQNGQAQTVVRVRINRTALMLRLTDVVIATATADEEQGLMSRLTDAAMALFDESLRAATTDNADDIAVVKLDGPRH